MRTSAAEKSLGIAQNEQGPSVARQVDWPEMHPDTLVTLPEAIRKIIDLEDRELAWTFFVIFSRMEYALKREKYLRSSKNDVKADWDAFALKQTSWPPPDAGRDLLDAIDYFQAHPPLKQVAKGDELRWTDAQDSGLDQSSLKWLLLMVRRVRNNLFHGGKFPMQPVGEPVRDRTLLRHSITILVAVIALDQRISEWFDDEI